MTEIHKPPGETEREALLEAQSSIDNTYVYVGQMAESLVAEVKDEWHKLRAEGGDLRRLNKLLGSELRSLLRLAMETEGSLNGIRSDRAGKAGAYAINFTDARTEIRSRLDRIRLARDADLLS